MEEERVVRPSSTRSWARAILIFTGSLALASPPNPSGEPPAAPTVASASAVAPAPAPALDVGSLEVIRSEVRLRHGDPLLLNFWAMWCEPCVEELPDLAKIEVRFATTGIRVLGVSSDLALEDDSPALREKVAATLAKAGVRYRNLLYVGETDLLLEAFDLPGSIPYSILYSADGKVLKRWNGRVALADLEKALSKLPKRAPRS